MAAHILIERPTTIMFSPDAIYDTSANIQLSQADGKPFPSGITPMATCVDLCTGIVAISNPDDPQSMMYVAPDSFINATGRGFLTPERVLDPSDPEDMLPFEIFGTDLPDQLTHVSWLSLSHSNC